MIQYHRACLSGSFLLLTSPCLHAALIRVGTGPDTSYFTLETPNLGIRQYAVNYHYDPLANPLGGTALLKVIEASDPELSLTINDFGTPSQPNEFFSAVTLDGLTESNDFAPGGSTFVHWVAGGQAGAADLGVPGPVPVPENEWVLGAGLSVNFRLIEPGSNDALVFAPTQREPTTAPVPEPSGLLLLGLALGLTIVRRRSF